MNLKSRLSRLQHQAGSGRESTAPKPSVSDLRARIAELEKHGRARQSSRKPAGTPASSLAGLEHPCGQASARTRLADSPAGAPPSGAIAESLTGEQVADGLIRIRKRVPLDGKLGAIALHSLTGQPLLPGEANNSSRRNVYIDTETTGLSGGSGTLAFLVGIAVVGSDAIELTQFLITRFAGEAAMLSAFAATLTPDDQLVSYNGKSYDLPLLVTRFRMQGLGDPFDGLPHLDLLHPTRRLFSSRWNDCRLITLEQKLLAFQRVDDLPGSEAPEAWFSYIRTGDDRQLGRVVEHNAQDIVSLAVAHSVLTQVIAQPRRYDADLPALGRWLGQYNENAALELLEKHREQLCEDGQRLLAHLSRRAGNWSQAVSLWEQLVSQGCTESLERLAKYHEHISKDLATAQRYCDRLPADREYEHRRRRIQGKIAAGTPLPHRTTG